MLKLVSVNVRKSTPDLHVTNVSIYHPPGVDISSSLFLCRTNVERMHHITSKILRTLTINFASCSALSGGGRLDLW